MQRSICCVLSVCLCLRPLTWAPFRGIEAFADVSEGIVPLRLTVLCSVCVNGRADPQTVKG